MAMCVRSFDKNGIEINAKDIVIKNDNIYKILKKYIQIKVKKNEVLKV